MAGNKSFSFGGLDKLLGASFAPNIHLRFGWDPLVVWERWADMLTPASHEEFICRPQISFHPQRSKKKLELWQVRELAAPPLLLTWVEGREGVEPRALGECTISALPVWALRLAVLY